MLDANHRFYILAYHRIGRARSLDGVTVAERVFVKQMKRLKRAWQPIGLGALVNRVITGQAIPSRAVAITFDDGYRDTFTAAFPVLMRLGLPATVFVTTRDCGLSWAMVRQMHRAGVEFGSHTMTHPNLGRCALRRLREEVARSRLELEDHLGTPAPLFAYPYGTPGTFNETVKAVVRDAGYAAACTMISGGNGPETDVFALRRTLPIRHEMRYLAIEVAEWVAGRASPRLRGVSERGQQLWEQRYQSLGRYFRHHDWTTTRPQEAGNIFGETFEGS